MNTARDPAHVVLLVTPHRQVLRRPGADQRPAVLATSRSESGPWRIPSGTALPGEDAGEAGARLAAELVGQPRSVLLLARLGEIALPPVAGNQSTVASVVQLEAPRSTSSRWMSGAPGAGGEWEHWAFVPVTADLLLTEDSEPIRPILALLDWTYWHRRGEPRPRQFRAHREGP